MDAEQKKLQNLVKRRHPEYDAKKPHWDFLEACYDGGRAWFEANIFRYHKEGPKEFKERKQRAYRFNHTREVCDLVNKHLFRVLPNRNEKDAPKSVQAFWKSATRNGQDINAFARQISLKSSMVGRPWIVVDNTATEGAQPVSKADEKQMGIRTYAYIVMPQHVLDFAYDDQGELLWVLIHEVARDDKDPLESSGDSIHRFRLWTRTDWTLYEAQGKGRNQNIVKVGAGEHKLGVVPIIPADNTISDEPYTSSALIEDIAYLDRAIANYLSNLDAIIQDQTFSQLIMPAQSLLPGEEGYDKLIEAGTKRVFAYDGEHGEPKYISPDPKQASVILAVVNKIIAEIYNTVGLAGERTKQDNAVGIDNSSGVAKAYDFEKVNALLIAKADSLEWVENRIAYLVALWNGEEKQIKDELVGYPDNFDVRSLYDEFDIAIKLSLIDAPDEVRQQQMELVIDKLFPKIAADLKQQMLDALKDWPPAPVLPAPAAPGAAPGKAANPQPSKQGQVTKETYQSKGPKAGAEQITTTK